MSAESMKKFWDEPLRTSFVGQVRLVTSKDENLEVVLEETYFYPEGGGQPPDRGTLAGLTVEDVQERSNVIVHILPDSEAARDLLKPGQEIAAEIDRPYRLQNMRLHTTCHVLFGAARLVFNSVQYAGFNIGESGSLYLKTDRLIRTADLRQMTRLANEAVVDQRAIHTWLIPPEEMNTIPGLAVNLRELPEGPLRIVDIEGWDIGACCGTHLPTTLEVGPIKAFNREFHKKNITRIDYTTGREAVELLAAEDETLGETAEFLGSNRSQVLPLVQRLSSDFSNSQKENQRLKEQLLTIHLEGLSRQGIPFGRSTLYAGHFDFLDPSGVRTAVIRLLESQPGCLAIISGGTGLLSLAVGCSSSFGIDLRATVMAVTKSFNGGGGGKLDLVSAGNIQTSPDQLQTELLEKLNPLFQ